MKFAPQICKSYGGVSAAGTRPTLTSSLTHRLTTGRPGVVDIDPDEVPESIPVVLKAKALTRWVCLFDESRVQGLTYPRQIKTFSDV